MTDLNPPSGVIMATLFLIIVVFQFVFVDQIKLKGSKGEASFIEGPKGEKGDNGTKGSRGDTGVSGSPGQKGEPGDSPPPIGGLVGNIGKSDELQPGLNPSRPNIHMKILHTDSHTIPFKRKEN